MDLDEFKNEATMQTAEMFAWSWHGAGASSCHICRRSARGVLSTVSELAFSQHWR